METTNTKNWRQELFNYMDSEHNVKLLESDMDQIQHICYPPDYPYIAHPATNTKLTAEEILTPFMPMILNKNFTLEEKIIIICKIMEWYAAQFSASAPAGEMAAEEITARQIRDWANEEYLWDKTIYACHPIKVEMEYRRHRERVEAFVRGAQKIKQVIA